jgi:hypothetical protein
MATTNFAYDHPTYLVKHQEVKTGVMVAGNVVQPRLTFRSRVACIVTGIAVVLNAVAGTATILLTLLHNGSVAAVLTLSNSANEVAREFTLTVNRTLTGLTDRFEISADDHDDGQMTVVYEYKIVPGATYSLNAAIS